MHSSVCVRAWLLHGLCLIPDAHVAIRAQGSVLQQNKAKHTSFEYHTCMVAERSVSANNPTPPVTASNPVSTRSPFSAMDPSAAAAVSPRSVPVTAGGQGVGFEPPPQSPEAKRPRAHADAWLPGSAVEAQSQLPEHSASLKPREAMLLQLLRYPWLRKVNVSLTEYLEYPLVLDCWP